MSKVKLINFCGRHDLIIFRSYQQWILSNLKTITRQFIFWRKQFNCFCLKESGLKVYKTVGSMIFSTIERNVIIDCSYTSYIYMDSTICFWRFSWTFLSVCCFAFLRNNFSKLLSSKIIHFIPQTLKSLVVSFSSVFSICFIIASQTWPRSSPLFHQILIIQKICEDCK